MNKTPAAGTSLKNAFRRFERAAHDLQERHASLRRQVEQLEQQVLGANRRLEAVIDAARSGIAVVSSDGRFLHTNQAFERLRLLDERRRPLHPALAELVHTEGSQGRSTRLRHDTSDGVRDLAAVAVPTGDAEGTSVLTVQDVTEIRREAEEGGRQRRLEALGRMAAELAHEVRNPLGSIRLFACMLRDDLPEDEERRAMVEQILAATAGLESTVSNLLAFASPARGQRRRVDAAAVARDVCELLAPACSVRGVRLDGPSADESCALTADPEGLRQVVLNLVGNALGATGSGGRIEVTARAAIDRVLLIVTDDGRGISSEDLPRVFDPFFTRTDGGTGLGLSIVHGIVERHGGRITLDSRPGAGTRARVELPATTSAPREQVHA